MYEDGKRAPVYGEPRDEGAELDGREEVDLEHGDGVRADGLVPESVDPQLGDWRGCPSVTRRTCRAGLGESMSLTFPPDSLPQLMRILGLRLVVLEMVDVDITSRSPSGSSPARQIGHKVKTYNPPLRPLSRGGGNLSYEPLKPSRSGLTRLFPSAFFSSESGGAFS